MDLLLLLLTAHFIGDFYLQPTRWVECRNKSHIKSLSLWKHLSVHVLLYSIVFLVSDYSFIQAVIAIALIAGSHLLIDLWKSHLNNNLSYFLIDQAIHLIIITLVWCFLSGFTASQLTLFFTQIFSAKNIIIAMAYLLVCKPASIVISLALKKYTDNLTQQKQDPYQDIGLSSAGAWIGYIERCLAVSFIFMGQFTGIGFLVATKTIFRFGDLTKSKDMKLTEYMMLGTLLSYAIALFIGWNTVQIYQAL